METIPISEFRAALTRLPKKLREKLDEGAITITQHGKPVMAIMLYEFYDAIIETLEILGDPELMASLQQGIKDVKEGRTISWEKVKKELSR